MVHRMRSNVDANTNSLVVALNLEVNRNTLQVIRWNVSSRMRIWINRETVHPTTAIRFRIKEGSWTIE